jgi:hypothetical protein
MCAMHVERTRTRFRRLAPHEEEEDEEEEVVLLQMPLQFGMSQHPGELAEVSLRAGAAAAAAAAAAATAAAVMCGSWIEVSATDANMGSAAQADVPYMARTMGGAPSFVYAPQPAATAGMYVPYLIQKFLVVLKTK